MRIAIALIVLALAAEVEATPRKGRHGGSHGPATAADGARPANTPRPKKKKKPALSIPTNMPKPTPTPQP